ncbi:MAG: molecular chaperone DnaK [Algoriphagus sp.]|nr:molecular chaperone DnaK [Algoriphagus sp.]
MKISKQDFLDMQAKYMKEVKKGKPGKNKTTDITDQTDWIFFDRETLENILAQADKDPKKGGIKFYLTEYTEETASTIHPENPETYVGRLALVLSPVTSESVEITGADGDGNYYNKGVACPPTCQ